MTTFVQFLPSDLAPFQFQPILAGGQQFQVTVPFNEAGQRYYISVSDLNGTLIAFTALAPTGPTLNGEFTWDEGVVTVQTAMPHLVPIGGVVEIRVSNSNTPFDGFYEALATDASTLTYSLPVNPLESDAVAGKVNFDLDLLAGFGVGPLWYHEDSQQFEF